MIIYFCCVIFFKVVVLTVHASYRYHYALSSISGNTGSYFATKTTNKAIKGPDFLGFMPLKTQFIWKSLNDQIKSFLKKKNMMTYDIEITSHHTLYFKHLGPYKQSEKQTDRQTYINT